MCSKPSFTLLNNGEAHFDRSSTCRSSTRPYSEDPSEDPNVATQALDPASTQQAPPRSSHPPSPTLLNPTASSSTSPSALIPTLAPLSAQSTSISHAKPTTPSPAVALSTPTTAPSRSTSSSSGPKPGYFSTCSRTSPKDPQVIIPFPAREVIPFLTHTTKPKDYATDVLVGLVWMLKKQGAYAWCYVVSHGVISQHDHGECLQDDQAALEAFKSFEKDAGASIATTMQGHPYKVCVKCWMPWPKAKHGRFSRTEPCPFQHLLPWLSFTILSDPELITSYTSVFPPAAEEYDDGDMLEDMVSMKGGSLGMWTAVKAIAKLIQLQGPPV
ncbi:hypothetical protein K439DRAFT_1620598 [Ramaria rubella]|nr:hypothetical protein K439DRAFT_1620598 [Ramaria rubella]